MESTRPPVQPCRLSHCGHPPWTRNFQGQSFPARHLDKEKRWSQGFTVWQHRSWHCQNQSPATTGPHPWSLVTGLPGDIRQWVGEEGEVQDVLGQDVLQQGPWDSKLKSRDITLSTKVHLVKAMVFPLVMYGCESWTIKKAECQRIDAFELWCWRRRLRVP